LFIVTKPDAEDSHAQPSGMPTLTVPLPPLAGKSWLVGDNAALHGAPSWVTVNVCCAIARVPLRVLLPGFAAAV